MNDSGGAHSGSDAHGNNTVLLVLALEFGKKSSDLSGTGASERVAKSNSTSLGVHLGVVDTDLVDRVLGL